MNEEAMTPPTQEGKSHAPALPPALAAFLNDSYIFEWQNQSFREDLIFVLPIAVCLCVGLAVGHQAAGMIAAGGAMTIGFGAKQDIDDSELLPMIFGTLGISFSTFVGMVVGHENYLLVGMAALWGFGYGMLSTREAGYGWVGQQCVVMLVVGSAFPASAEASAQRSLLVLAGGALQVLSSSVLLRLFGKLREHLRQLTTYIRAEQTELLRAMQNAAASWKDGRLENTALPYSFRLAI